MPQMGESVAEGTIVRWMKKVGDTVDRDEPLFEISTDKVDAEIPSPSAGVVAEIRAQEGETVPVNSVVAVIKGAGEVVAAAPAAGAPPATPAAREPEPAARPVSRAGESLARERSSPLVRQLAAEHHVEISQVQGTGIGGRVTKHDILAFVEQRGRGAGQTAVESTPIVRGAEDRVEKMSVMRKKIAEHMVLSRRTAAHVHSVFEVNLSRVSGIRESRKAAYEAQGTKLTYLSFIVKAAAEALQAWPVINASTDGDQIVYHKDVNIGVAVALEWGLIVPVIRNADQLDLIGLSRAIADLAAKARAKQLKPEDVSSGTFTVTNPGAFGALFGMPIINQPQLAILDVGAIEKRPVVVNDTVMACPTAFMALGFDHRIIDGAVGDQFMSRVKQTLENWDEKQA
ncbi:MAG TPA: dihydrolipoamide acetyltransferase family protein [Vicinamibacterales bacterium]|nr:dihydrolipoamide acetyltransferase family protein [Vicinamibacterales bacterium]